MLGKLFDWLRRRLAPDDSLQRESLNLSRLQVALAKRQMKIAIVTLVFTIIPIGLTIWTLLPDATPELDITVKEPEYRSRIVGKRAVDIPAPPKTSDKPEDRCESWRDWLGEQQAAFPDIAVFNVIASAPVESGATVTTVVAKVTRSYAIDQATDVVCQFSPPSETVAAPRIDLSRDRPSIAPNGGKDASISPISMAAGTTSTIPFVVTGEPGRVYEWVAEVIYRVGTDEQRKTIGSAERPFRSYVGYTGRLSRVTYSDAERRWVDADKLLPRTDYIYVTSRGLAQLNIGSPESAVLAYTRALLGPPEEVQESEITGCVDARRYRRYRWGNLGVNFVLTPNAVEGRLSGFDYNVTFAQVDPRDATPKNVKLFGQVAIGEPAAEAIRSQRPTIVPDDRTGTNLTVVGHRKISDESGDFYGLVVYTSETGAFSGAFTHIPEADGLCNLDRWIH